MPFDTQVCDAKVSGFLHLGREIHFNVPDGRDLGPNYDFTTIFTTGVRAVCPATGTVEWKVVNVQGVSVDGGGLAAVPSSYVIFRFTVTRESGYYGINVILPMVLLVVICWASFFVNRDAVPARVSMVIIAFLNISNQLRNTTNQLPKLSGSVWLLNLQSMTAMFMFYSILEYAFLNYVARVQKRVEIAVGVSQHNLLHLKGANYEESGPSTSTSAATADDDDKKPRRPVENLRDCLKGRVSLRPLNPHLNGVYPVKRTPVHVPTVHDVEVTARSVRRRSVGAISAGVAHIKEGLSSAEDELDQERNHIMRAAKARKLPTAHPSHLTSNFSAKEVHDELKMITGAVEKLFVKEVIQVQEGVWVPIFHLTCDRVDVLSRWLFPVACEPCSRASSTSARCFPYQQSVSLSTTLRWQHPVFRARTSFIGSIMYFVPITRAPSAACCVQMPSSCSSSIRTYQRHRSKRRSFARRARRLCIRPRGSRGWGTASTTTITRT